jgi:recombination protein RecA
MGEPALDALRERIRAIEGEHVRQERIPSGVPAVDRLLGGLPSPGVVEITGPLGSGRVRLVAALLAQVRGQPLAWVDPRGRLYPPALAAWGVDLGLLLIVRPPGDRDGWAVEQLCRSGCFPIVVASDPIVGGRWARGWSHAAEAGRCTLIVLGERPERHLPACVRLAMRPQPAGGRGEVVVMRDRRGPLGLRGELPPWPDAADPWA